MTGAVNLAFTCVALFTIDRYGRRALLLTGVSGLCILYITLGSFYALHVHGKPMLILVLLAIAFYAMSLAPVTWVVISEIYPNRVRGIATSIAIAALWIASFVLTYTFPILNMALGAEWRFAILLNASVAFWQDCFTFTRGFLKPRARALKRLKRG